jgi:hypothetical protein
MPVNSSALPGLWSAGMPTPQLETPNASRTRLRGKRPLLRRRWYPLESIFEAVERQLGQNKTGPTGDRGIEMHCQVTFTGAPIR